ncbi:MAG: hypothetical protein ACXVEE_06085 [Polyangiales bacterium]
MRLGPTVYGASCCARVAVKVRSLACTRSWESHERFERAARWLEQVSHPGFPTVHAFDPAGAVLVVERLEETLHARVTRGAEALDDAGVRALLRGVLEPLARLHRDGFVHGEVTPRAVMFRGEKPVLTGCGVFARDGDPSEDVRAVAETVLFARRGRLSSELRSLFAAMLASDPKARPKNAGEALRMLDGAPLPGAMRSKLVAAACIGLAVTLVGAVEWKPHPRANPEAPVGPNACRIVSDPPGASVFLGDRDVAWSEDHPLDRALGETPLVVDRDPTHPLVVHRSGYRPFVLEMTAPRAGEGPCAFTVKLRSE